MHEIMPHGPRGDLAMRVLVTGTIGSALVLDLISARALEAAGADGVIHAALDNEFSNFAVNCGKDRRAIAAMGAVPAGSDRPLLITSGTWLGSTAPGRPATEDAFGSPNPPPGPRHGQASAGEGVPMCKIAEA